MTEIEYMREIENLEARNRKLSEALTACKIEVNKLRAALEVTSSDCKEAFADNERLRLALREIAKHPRGGVIDTPEKMDRDEFIGIARAALEGK